jgi:hypothetical protein
MQQSVMTAQPSSSAHHMTNNGVGIGSDDYVVPERLGEVHAPRHRTLLRARRKHRTFNLLKHVHENHPNG